MAWSLSNRVLGHLDEGVPVGGGVLTRLRLGPDQLALAFCLTVLALVDGHVEAPRPSLVQDDEDGEGVCSHSLAEHLDGFLRFGFVVSSTADLKLDRVRCICVQVLFIRHIRLFLILIF